MKKVQKKKKKAEVTADQKKRSTELMEYYRKKIREITK